MASPEASPLYEEEESTEEEEERPATPPPAPPDPPARRQSVRKRSAPRKLQDQSEERPPSPKRRAARKQSPKRKGKKDSEEEDGQSDEEEKSTPSRRKPSTRRKQSPRQKRKEESEEDSQGSEEEEQAPSRAPKRQSPIKRSPRQKRKISYRESDQEDFESDDEIKDVEDEDEPEEELKGSLSAEDDNKEAFSDEEEIKSTRLKSPPGNPQGTPEQRTCPHCKKVFSKIHNLKYHVENYVCRKDQMPEELKEEIERKKQERWQSDAEETETEMEEEQEMVGRKRKRPKKEATKQRDSTDGPSTAKEGKQTKKPGRKKSKRTPATKASGQKNTRFRGPLEERTCPKCKRVFTSILGKDYHVANRVCEQGRFKKKKVQPFGPLEPGAQFVTKFGVVQVIQDSRAVPTATLSKENERKLKLWKGAKGRLDNKRRDQHSKVAVHSLARRKRLRKLYEPTQTNNSNLQTKIWNAYFGSRNLDNPREGGGHWNFPQVAPEFPPGPYPMEPEGSYPDRIVECVLIKDKRKVFECFTINNNDNKQEFMQREKELPEAADGMVVPMKFYIERRALNTEYSENGSRFQCVDCGRVFVSIVGCKYHVTTKACHNKMGRKGEKHDTPEQMRAGLNRRAEVLIEAQDQLLSEEKSGKAYRKDEPIFDKAAAATKATESEGKEVDPEIRDKIRREKEVRAAKTVMVQPRNNGQYSKKQRKWLPKKKRPLAYYPQVWRSLGFKVVPKTPRAAPVSFFKKKKKGDQVFPNAQLTEKIHGADDLQNTMKSLQEELIQIQSEQLGAYYPSVWKVLRFKKPSTSSYTVRRSEDVSEADDDIAPVGKKRSKSPPPFVPQPPPFAYAPPVIIDISVLAGEIDMGRYPSMKRNSTNEDEEAGDSTDKHADSCYMCKDSRGLLYLCDFCTNVNHLECIRTRFIIKDPEPHDDFMCNKCIQCVLQRRRRAEKRRMRRSLGDNAPEEKTIKRGPYGETAAEDANLDPEPTKDAEPENEYDALAAQGQHVEEILELLRDSQARLHQLVETSKINGFRRSLFE